MKNILSKLTLCALLMVAAISCKVNDYDYYDQSSSTIYFNLDQMYLDSMMVSFTRYINQPTIELQLPIEIAGYAADHDRTFKLKVVADKTTAQVNTHYKALEKEYTLPKGCFKTTVPVTLYNTDPTLNERSYRLYIEVENTNDFAQGVYYRQSVDIRFSNILMRPANWDSFYAGYFGTYSKTKHAYILSVCKLLELPESTSGSSWDMTWESYGRIMNKYFDENTIYDENGALIAPWWPVNY